MVSIHAYIGTGHPPTADVDPNFVHGTPIGYGCNHVADLMQSDPRQRQCQRHQQFCHTEL